MGRKPSSSRKLGAKWRVTELPVKERAELRDRIGEAKNGTSLMDFEEALRLAERLTGDVLVASDSRSDRTHRD